MKKYLLVCWDVYYPGGGLSNIIDSFDTIEECEVKAKESRLTKEFDYVEIYDRDTIQLVKNIK